VNRLAPALERLQTSTPWRAWQRYSLVRGNVLAGGIAYFAFFSLFPALALGFTVFGIVVDGRTDLLQRVADGINSTFGTTVVGRTSGEGLWTTDQLVQAVRGDVLTVAGLVGVGVLLFSGLGWIGALRDGVSAVFGREHGPNPVVAKASDLGVLAVLGLSVLGSLAGGLLVTATTGPVLDWLGLGRSRVAGVLVSVLSALVLLAIDTALFLLLFRVLSGVRPSLDDMFTAALAGGVGMGLLKLGGGILLRLMSSGNRFAAAASLVVGVLIWMNLAARLALLAAAWAATTAADNGHLVLERPRADGATVEPPAGSPVAPPAPRPVFTPTYGPRAADRTTLVAGALLGATAAVGARVLGQAARALRVGPRRVDD
jgi:membrane protein